MVGRSFVVILQAMQWTIPAVPQRTTTRDRHVQISPYLNSNPLMPTARLLQDYKHYSPSPFVYFDDFNLVELYSNRADDAKLEDSALESKARNMPWETPISSLKWSNFRECYTTARMDQDDSNSSARLLEAKLPIPTKRKREILKLSPRGEDSDSRDYLNSDNKKSRPKEKGLRRLSQRAYNIVCGMHAASYKQVANRLVDQLHQQKELNETKDEQNIKRRVYDALNVLIALGVLRKEGRKIVEEQRRRDQRIERLKLQLALKAAAIEKKRAQVEELSDRLQGLQWLTDRNKARREEDPAHSSRIELPFVVKEAGDHQEFFQSEDEFPLRNLLDSKGQYGTDNQFIKLLRTGV